MENLNMNNEQEDLPKGAENSSTPTKKSLKEKTKPKFLNVSGAGNNCGLYALLLSSQLGLILKPELEINVTIPDFAKNFPVEELIASGQFSEKDIMHEIKIRSLGEALRKELGEALRNNNQNKIDRYNHFQSLCRNYLHGDKVELNEEMEAFYSNKENMEFIIELNRLWIEEKEKLNINNNEWTTNACYFINETKINDLDIQAVRENIINLAKQQDYNIDTLFQDVALSEGPLQNIIQKYKLYKSAWKLISGGDLSSQQREKFVAEMNQYLFSCALEISKLNPQLKTILGLLENLDFNEDNLISNTQIFDTNYESIVSSISRYFVEPMLLPVWDNIYENYCKQISDSIVMITADELGCLAQQWNVELIINFSDIHREPYKTTDFHDPQKLEIKIGNPSLIHYQVDSDNVPECFKHLLQDSIIELDVSSKSKFTSSSGSKNLGINSWYNEMDISNYVLMMIKNAYGGFAKDSPYLLQGNGDTTAGKFKDTDGKDYFVAFVDAIDLRQDMNPQCAFLNKSLHNSAVIKAYTEILNNIDKLKGLEDSKLFEKLKEILVPSIIEEAMINKVIMKLKDIEFDYFRLNNEINLLAKKSKKDVLDEILVKMSEEDNAKIIFPYCVNDSIWLTCEIKLNKIGNNLNFIIQAYDPYGKDQISKELLGPLTNAIQEKYKGSEFTVKIENRKVDLEARQSPHDAVSSGIIVSEEILKRLTGQEISAQLYENQAIMLRIKHVENMNKYLHLDSHIRKNFIAKNAIPENILKKQEQENISRLKNKQSAFLKDMQLLCDMNTQIELFMTAFKLADFEGCKQALAAIGVLAKVSHNDKDKTCIRNKHGYIDRSNSGQIRETGVAWENLCLLNDIFNAAQYNGVEKSEYHKLFEVGLTDICNEIGILQNSIQLIINLEKPYFEEVQQNLIDKENVKLKGMIEKLSISLVDIPVKIGEVSAQTPNIRVLTNYFQDERGLQHLFNISDNNNSGIYTIDLSSRRCRYELARALLIIGETVNNLSYDAKMHDTEIPYKQFVNIRNGLTHRWHGKLIDLQKSYSIALGHLQDISNEGIPIIFNKRIMDVLTKLRDKKVFNQSEFDAEETWKLFKEAVIVVDNIIDDINIKETSKKIADTFSRAYIEPLVIEILYGKEFDTKAATTEQLREIGNLSKRFKEAILSEQNRGKEDISVQVLDTKGIARNLKISFPQEAQEMMENYFLKKTLEEKLDKKRREIEEKKNSLKRKKDGFNDEKKILQDYSKLTKGIKNKNMTLDELVIKFEEDKLSVTGSSQSDTQRKKTFDVIIGFLNEQKDKSISLQVFDEITGEKLKLIASNLKDVEKELGEVGQLHAKKDVPEQATQQSCIPSLKLFISELSAKTTSINNQSVKDEFEQAEKILDNLIKEIEFVEKMIEENQDKPQVFKLFSNLDLEYAIGTVGQLIRDLRDKETAYELMSELSAFKKVDEGLQRIIVERNQGLLHDIYTAKKSDISTIATEHVIPIKEDLQNLKKQFSAFVDFDKNYSTRSTMVYDNMKSNKFYEIAKKLNYSQDDSAINMSDKKMEKLLTEKEKASIEKPKPLPKPKAPESEDKEQQPHRPRGYSM